MKKSILKVKKRVNEVSIIKNLKRIKGGHVGKGYSRPKTTGATREGHATIIK